MKRKTYDLFWDIVECREVANTKSCLLCDKNCCLRIKCSLDCKDNGCSINQKSTKCYCSPIVYSQFKIDYKQEWQCPEPWVGDLDKAEYLFLSSNPSIDRNEFTPTLNGTFSKWINTSDMNWMHCDDVENFFIRRFDSNYKIPAQNSTHSSIMGRKCVSTDFRPLRRDGSRGYNQDYWRDITKYLYAISGLALPSGSKPTPDFLYEKAVLSEVVHCKSRSEFGVDEALPICAEYTKRLIEIFASNGYSKMIIVVGSKAEPLFRKISGIKINDTRNVLGKIVWSKNKPDITVHTISIGGRNIDVIFVPHPNGRHKALILNGITVKGKGQEGQDAKQQLSD